MEEKRNINPLLLKFGVALALSFAGFLYSRFRTRKIKPSPPPSSPRSSSDHGSKADSDRGRGRPRHDVQSTKRTSISCNFLLHADDEYEETRTPKVSVDGSFIGLSPSSKHSGEKDGILLPEFHDLVKEFDLTAASAGFSPKKDVEIPKAFVSVEKDEHEQEIRQLRNMVRMLRERERNLEVQLLEYYGLKEQETAVMELQNRLKLNNMEAKLFTLKIESLQADNRRLESQVADHAKLMADLETARSKIKLLKKKLKFEAEHNKEQILNLQHRVEKLQDEEYKSADNCSDIQIKLKRLKDLEGEAEELRKSNKRLQLEISDMGRRLEATQFLANSVLVDPEVEAMKDESGRLRKENEELTKQIERLQADRCADVEELVYLRWINACLRYEVRNYQPPPGKTAARDLSKSLSPKSEEKAKQLILEYANTEGIDPKGITIMDFDSDHWSSSQHSYLTDSGDPDDSSVDFSSTHKTHTSNRSKFIGKLRRLLLRGKDSHHHHHHNHIEKSGSVEDGDSPQCSSGVTTANDTPREGLSVRYGNLSRSSSRPSFDVLHRSGSQNEDSIKSAEPVRMNSDVGSSYRRFVLSRESSCHLGPKPTTDQNTEFTEKNELLKYAEVFKDSRGASPQLRKKSASFSSF